MKPQPVQRDDQILVDRLYKLDDAAEFFAFKSASWLRKRIEDGTLAYVDLNPEGRPDYRVRASAINDLIERYSYQPASPRLKAI